MRRVGKFTVPASIFRLDYVELMRALQKLVVVFNFNSEPWRDTVDIVGVCDDFAPVEYGCIIPEYICTIDIDEDDNHVVWFSKNDN